MADCQRTIPAIVAEELADAIDVFVTEERSPLKSPIAFCVRGGMLDSRSVSTHELSASGGCKVASALGAKSADHLEHATDEDLDAP